MAKSKRSLFPGLMIILIGILALALQTNWTFPGDLAGGVGLWCVALFFALVYAHDSDKWWSAIPAGTCFTLGTIVLIDRYDLLSNDLYGVILFLGLGLTFLYLWSQRDPQNNLSWAKYPAIVLLHLALLLCLKDISWLHWKIVLPIILILAGIAIIIKSSVKKS